MASGIDGENETKVGWVSTNCQRSTYDVLWSCLSVVLVCTYKVIHLNLPARRESEAPWAEFLFWKRWLRKLKWMAFMALSPELLLAMALGDFLWSRQNERKFARIRTKHERSLRPQELDRKSMDLVQDKKVTSTDISESNYLPFRYAWHISIARLTWGLLTFIEVIGRMRTLIMPTCRYPYMALQCFDPLIHRLGEASVLGTYVPSPRPSLMAENTRHLRTV